MTLDKALMHYLRPDTRPASANLWRAANLSVNIAVYGQLEHTMASLDSIREKVVAGTRINDEDALFLFESSDLFGIGELADRINRRKNAGLAYYNVNRHVNPTNICVMTCKFCAYSRKPGEEGGYEYSIDEILEKIGIAAKEGAREIHMVGGLHPRWRLKHYIDILTSVKAKFPEIHLKAFTAVEIDWLARRSRLSIKELLVTLKAAGLDSMPGGGAEIFHQDVRDAITAKLSTEEWIDVHRTAHNLGMHSNCTMLYGHVENYAHRVDHLSHLRRLQDETGGFNAFIPLSFQPHNNEMGITRYTFGPDDLKTLAVSRLYLDNFQHIKAYWIMLGQDIAQVCLNFGANDIDGTVSEEKISNMAGSQGGMAMSKDQIEELILKTHHNACERDTLYNQVGEVKIARKIIKSRLGKVEEIANRLTITDHLSTASYLEIINGASFHELCTLANIVGTQRFGEQHRTFSPAVIVHGADFLRPDGVLKYISDKLSNSKFSAFKDTEIAVVFDLGLRLSDQELELPFADVCRIISAVHQQHPDLKLVFAGIQRIMMYGTALGQSLDNVITALKVAGINIVEPSSKESELVLTTRDIIDFHRTAHSQNMPTVAKIELQIAEHSRLPLWEAFIERAIQLDLLQAETRGFYALAIEPDQDSQVTISEFLESVAVSRIMSKHFARITTPLTSLPAARKLPQARGFWDPSVMKIAALPMLAGAVDLGHIDLDVIDYTEVAATVLAGAHMLKIRDFQFDAKPTDLLPSISGSLRHVPLQLRKSLSMTPLGLP
jgi:aminodeoxyfutalosine synthase